MMSHQLELAMNKAVRKANQLHHEYLTLESVLLALLDDDQVVQAISECGANIDLIRNELTKFLEDEQNFSILSEHQIEELGQKQFLDEELRSAARSSGIYYQPEISLSLQRVIQRAAFHAQSSSKNQILGINVLISMFQEKESFAIYILEKEGVGRFNLVQAVAHDLDRPVNSSSEQAEVQIGNNEDVDEDEASRTHSPKRKKSILEEYGVNLNSLAKKGRIDPLIGREREIQRVIQILSRRRKNNPLLVGDAGVGKTAIAEGLSWSIVEGKVPDILKKTEIYTIDIASLIAGAKFRGDFEQRLRLVLKEVGDRREKGEDIILFIDELHTVMGAGATGSGSMDASNLLKPYLSSGQVRLIGSSTHEEYRKFIEKDSAFSRRFQKVDVDEPSMDDSYKILLGLKEKFETHHGVKYSNTVLKAAVELSNKYISDRRLPDKAIDLIDEAGALVKLSGSGKRSSVTTKDLENVVALIAKMPKRSIVGDEKDKLRHLKENLKRMIYGQDQAVEIVTDAILLSRSGLGNENRPLGCFLFAGPTGVGKTELARQLAFQMGIHFERFDMSEYMEKHSVAKLIGAPPGYIGHDNGGQLTDALKKNPYSVLLLDEIEKAHPDIFNVLLQVMDHGALTDSQGRTTNFKNIILVMTTNAGAKEMESGSIGLSTKAGPNSSKRDQALKNFFSPEFRNRLDGIVQFNKLGLDSILDVVDKFLALVFDRLAEKGIELKTSLKVREWLAKNGHDDKMGARPIERLINEKITKPLSKEIIFGRHEKGDQVIVDVLADHDDLDQDVAKEIFSFKWSKRESKKS